MAFIPVNTPLHQGFAFALGLLWASALPAWSAESLKTGAATRPGWQAGSPLAKGSTAGSPTVPTWSVVPLAPLENPGWNWLPKGPSRAPVWSPPVPLVINKAPLWKRL